MNLLDEFRQKLELLQSERDIAAWHYNHPHVRVKYCSTGNHPPSWVVYDDSEIVRGKIVQRMLAHSYTSPFDALIAARAQLESEETGSRPQLT